LLLSCVRVMLIVLFRLPGRGRARHQATRDERRSWRVAAERSRTRSDWRRYEVACIYRVVWCVFLLMSTNSSAPAERICRCRCRQRSECCVAGVHAVSQFTAGIDEDLFRECVIVEIQMACKVRAESNLVESNQVIEAVLLNQQSSKSGNNQKTSKKEDRTPIPASMRLTTVTVAGGYRGLCVTVCVLS
jgi:hypothetical protein